MFRSALMVVGLAALACGAAPCSNTPAAGPGEPTAVTPAPAQASSEEAARTARAPGRADVGVTAHCANYATVTAGSFEYMNNMFAMDQAQGPYDQCILVRTQHGKREYGWTWMWTGYEPFAFAFPELIFGWKPWSQKSTDARLPMALADVGELSVRYAVDVTARGAHNLTLAAWLTETGSVSPQSIAAEVVVWLDATPGTVPTGTLAPERVEVNGVEHELWVNLNHGDRGDGKGWDLMYLRNASSGTPANTGTVQLGAFLGALTAAGKLRPESWVASVEFGNELKGGSGTLWIRDFQVVLMPRA